MRNFDLVTMGKREVEWVGWVELALKTEPEVEPSGVTWETGLGVGSSGVSDVGWEVVWDRDEYDSDMIGEEDLGKSVFRFTCIGMGSK